MIRVILTDIEGTTSSISFVHDVLFPYAAANLADFIQEAVARDDDEVKVQLRAVAEETGVPASDVDGLIAALQQWIKEDRKATPLKALQGMIWEKGYRNGDFQGHVYPDAGEKLREWHDRGLRLYVYSSGSVQAQKLIFGFSSEGDLTPFFSGYFDTRMGAKRETAACQNILNELGVDADTVMFLSDIEQELEAAEEAGMHTVLLVRDESTPDTARQVARDFQAADAIIADID